MPPITGTVTQIQPIVRFTTLGFVAFGIVGLLLASNATTGPIVVWILILLIIAVILGNYQRIMSTFFQVSYPA